MFTPTRTPEGFPNRCPICEHEVIVEPTYLFGDATCPRCGTLLWYIQLESQRLIYEREDGKHLKTRLVDLLAERLGIDRDQVTPDILTQLKHIGADSLDAVEIVMELEEELSFTLGDDDFVR